ncbi:MAG TPA: hypothetical protein V6C85_25310 [Allocoleopsis sp.]
MPQNKWNPIAQISQFPKRDRIQKSGDLHPPRGIQQITHTMGRLSNLFIERDC